MTIANDHIDRLQRLASDRLEFEHYWQQAAEIAAPEVADFTTAGVSNIQSLLNNQRPLGAQNSKKLYDSTAVWCVDRLASGIEALVMGQSEYWHGLGVVDLKKAAMNHDTNIWLENLREKMFSLRYDGDAGFVPAIQTALRRCVVFGNGFVFVEDGVTSESIFRYSYLPLKEAYVAEDAQGTLDTMYRVYTLTARQARQRFGERVSPAIKRATESPVDMDKPFTFIKAIVPRGDAGRLGDGTVFDAKFACLDIDVETKIVVKESGFFEFPILDFRWLAEPGRVYGEGPIMKALADIQGLNKMAKNELTAVDQSVAPPLLVANSGVLNRPNTAPRSVIMGGLNAQGQAMVQPLITSQRLDFAAQVMEAKKNAVKESLYINLFAVLIRNPEMSATEAMIRSKEKGELLGPAGSRLQGSLSKMVKRELGIMSRAGAFSQGAMFEPPQQLQNRVIKVESSSLLDRYRQGAEVEGTIQLVNLSATMAQADETVMDNWDANEVFRGLADRLGVPKKFIKSTERVEEARAAREQQAAMMQQAQIAKDMAAASKSGVEAMAAGQQAGII